MACGDLLLDILDDELEPDAGQTPLWQALEAAAQLPVVVHPAEWAAVMDTIAEHMEAACGPDRRVSWLKSQAARTRRNGGYE